MSFSYFQKTVDNIRLELMKCVEIQISLKLTYTAIYVKNNKNNECDLHNTMTMHSR